MNATAVKTETLTETLTEAEEKYTGYPVVLSRRPERDTVINREDILNLKIALETSKTWEEFLSRV